MREQLFRFSTPLPDYDFAIMVANGRLRESRFIAVCDKSATRTRALTDTERRLRDGIRNFLSRSGGFIPRARLEPAGTNFGNRFRDALQVLAPPGRTVSYGAIARHAASSARAVGQACSTNPLALFVPCHRVLAAHGPGGYCNKPDGSPDLELKRHLLLLEGADIDF